MPAQGMLVNVSGWFCQKADAKPYTLDGAAGWTLECAFLADMLDDSDACTQSVDHNVRRSATAAISESSLELPSGKSRRAERAN